ncbi:MAG: L-histidine N(alpha)-methyltransferase [Clostridia bacterium]
MPRPPSSTAASKPASTPRRTPSSSDSIDFCLPRARGCPFPRALAPPSTIQSGDTLLNQFSDSDRAPLHNERLGRVEMHLVCLRDHQVTIAGEPVPFRAGETIHTENSYKYTVEGFHSLTRAAGLVTAHAWVDGHGLYSLHHLIVP